METVLETTPPAILQACQTSIWPHIALNGVGAAVAHLNWYKSIYCQSVTSTQTAGICCSGNLFELWGCCEARKTEELSLGCTMADMSPCIRPVQGRHAACKPTSDTSFSW